MTACTPGPNGVVILDEQPGSSIRELRTRADSLGIIVLLEDQDDRTPRAVVSLIDAGADVCLVAPGSPGSRRTCAALAAHHPEHTAPQRACLA